MSNAYRRLTAAETAALERLARMRDRRLRASTDLELGRAEAAVARVMRAALDPAAPFYNEHSAQLAAIEADGLRRVARAPASQRFAAFQWRRAATLLFGTAHGDDE